MLTVNLTYAIRSNADKVEFVNANSGAPADEPETDWVEWKIELDIVPAEGAFEAARTMLGFGNRESLRSGSKGAPTSVEHAGTVTPASPLSGS